MNNKVCGKCGNYYDVNLTCCPHCSNDNNSNNNINNESSLIEKFDNIHKINEEYKENNVKKDISSIFFEEVKEEKEDKEEQKIVVKQKNNNHNNSFSYLLLIESMTLMFICIISNINEFNIPIFCHYLITAIILLFSFNLIFRNKTFGFYLTSIASISMICMFFESDYISSVIGVYILFYSMISIFKSK